MSVYELPGIHPPLSEEELLQGLIAPGPAPPEAALEPALEPAGIPGQEPFDIGPYDAELAAIRGEQFQPSRLERVLESIYGGMGSLRPPRAKNFGQGLAIGAVSGLAGQGRHVARAREQFSESQTRRLLAVDTARRQAQEAAAREGRGVKREIARETRRADAKGPMPTVLITPELVKQFPALKSLEGTTQPTGAGSVYRRLTTGTPAGNRAPARPRAPRANKFNPGPAMPELSAVSGAYNREARAADMTGNAAKGNEARKVQSSVDRFHADIRQAQTADELRAIEYPAGLPPDVEAAFKKALHNRERQIASRR